MTNRAWWWVAFPHRSHLALTEIKSEDGLQYSYVVIDTGTPRPHRIRTLCGTGPFGATTARQISRDSAPECRVCWRRYSTEVPTFDPRTEIDR